MARSGPSSNAAAASDEAPSRRVLLLGSYGPSLYRFRRRLIRDLVASGAAVTGATPDRDPDGSLARTMADLGARYRVAPLHQEGMNPVRDLATLFQLVRLMRAEKPDAVLAYTAKPVIYGTLAAWFARVPRRIAMITGMGFAFTPGGGWRRHCARGIMVALYRLALPRASHVFLQNRDDQRTLIDYRIAGACRSLEVVPGSGLDTTHYAAAPLPADYADRPVFLMIARLIQDKGIFEYLEAARAVKARYPQATFQLVGRRHEHPGAVPLATLEALTSAGVIEQLPRTDDVRPYYRACSVYVLPSYREGTPRTVLEAMAMGRPAITTDAPGCRSTVVDGESGVLIPVGDSDALAAAMADFCAQPARIPAMGAAARQRAAAVFDVAGVNRAIGRALGFSQLIDSRHRAACATAAGGGNDPS